MRDASFRITLDVNEQQSQVSIPVHVGDTSRRIYISLTENGLPFPIEEGDFAIFTGVKGDGNPIADNCIVENGRIRYDFREETVSAKGIFECEIQIFDLENEGCLYAPRFTIIVDDRLVDVPEMFSGAEPNGILKDIVSAEASRVLAEDGRVEAEKARRTEEDIRKGNEKTRQGQEKDREEAFGGWIETLDEHERVWGEAEKARDDAEKARDDAETLRDDAEKVRDAAEKERVEAEQTRGIQLGLKPDYNFLHGLVFVDNYLLSKSSRKPEAFNNWWVTEPIYCKGANSVSYYANTTSTAVYGIAFYTEDLTFISGIEIGNEETEIPAAAYYLRLSGNAADKEKCFVKLDKIVFPLPEIPNDTINHEMFSDNFLGTGVAVTSGKDANTLLDVGDYLCYSGVTNLPTTAMYGVSVRWYKGASSSYIVRQTAINYVTGDVYERLCQVSKPSTEWKYVFTEWKDVINDHTKPLDGKTIVLFGDSITVLGNVIANKIAETTGATVINCGFSGCRMARHGTDVYSHYGMGALATSIGLNDFTEQENNLANAGSQKTAYTNTLNVLKDIDFSGIDYISIAYGTNDWWANVPLKNDDNDVDIDTFEGALRFALQTLYTKNPLLRINVCTPLYRFVWSNGAVTDDSDTKTNTLGLKLTDYITSLEKVCGEFHTQVVDLYSEVGFNKYTASVYFPSGDGTHPNVAGRELIGKKIATEIMRNNGIV